MSRSDLLSPSLIELSSEDQQRVHGGWSRHRSIQFGYPNPQQAWLCSLGIPSWVFGYFTPRMFAHLTATMAVRG